MYKAQGKSYNTIRELAEAFNLSYSLVYSRLNKNNWTVEQAVGLEKRPKHPSMKSIKFRGNKYGSYRQLTDDYNADYNKFLTRKNIGWSIEESLGLVERPSYPQSKSVVFRGKKFDKLGDIARHYGVEVRLFNSRRSQGWSIEEALELVERNKNKE